jgi:hypothetical protein
MTIMADIIGSLSSWRGTGRDSAADEIETAFASELWRRGIFEARQEEIWRQSSSLSVAQGCDRGEETPTADASRHPENTASSTV